MSLFTMTRKALLIALVAGSLGAAAQPSQDEPNVKVYDPDSTPYGMSYAEWNEAWWHWALSFPLDESPVTDETGDLAGLGQSGPVWFLAGTFGGAVERTVTIPKDKSLLIPIVNLIGVFFPEPGEEPPTEEEFRALADFVIGAGVSFECTIDGVEIEGLGDFRAQTGLFAVTVPEGGLFPEGTHEPAIADGFYIMIKPLKPGSHTIHFAGTIDLIGLEVEATYNITVSDEK